MRLAKKKAGLLRTTLLLVCSFWSFRISLASAPVAPLTFSFESWTYENVTFPYRKAVIATGSGQPTPILVVYLHGGPKRGNDNVLQMQEQTIFTIAGYLKERNIHAVMLVPQCPDSLTWGVETNEAVRQLIEDYTERGEVDAHRIYLLGGSMGGTGTWLMASAYPCLFAAVMPVAGNPETADSDRVANTPVYTVMGSNDRLMTVPRVVDFVERLKGKGGEAIMDVENGWGHVQTCTDSYTPQRLDWIFSHTRQYECDQIKDVNNSNKKK